MTAAGSFASKTADPATRIDAPCSASLRACSVFTPPSIETSTAREPSSVRIWRIFGYTAGISFWPPNPGLTDITRPRSRSAVTESSVGGQDRGRDLDHALLYPKRLSDGGVGSR